MQRKEFLEILYRKLNVDFSIDMVFDHINNLLLEKNFKEVNRILEDINIEQLQSFALLAFLTITIAAKDKLPSREVYYNSLQDILSPNLLKGLE